MTGDPFDKPGAGARAALATVRSRTVGGRQPVVEDNTERAVSRLLERRAATADGRSTIDTSASITTRRQTFESPRMLMVIDDFMTRVRVRELAEAASLTVDSSPDTQSAIERARAGGHVLIVTDNLSVIKSLRAMPLTVVPHIIFVADSDGEACVAGLLGGADDAFAHEATPELIQARLVTAGRIAKLESSLTYAAAQNKRVSWVDELTRAGNRRYFDRHLPREMRHASRKGLPITVALCDIDHFKMINDSHGHPAGDKVLREFSRRILERLREGQDWFARIGGEEFALVLSQTGPEAARAILRRMREVISEKTFALDRKEIRVTASFGAAGLEEARDGDDAFGPKLVEAADQALYKSKESGRNRVTIAIFRKG